MLYLNSGLYFEGEAPPGPVRYLSQTDELDAWVLHDRELRRRPAPKPRQRLDELTRRVLATLAEERPPGWVAAGCSLLNASGDSREQMARELKEARQRARVRDKIQRGTYRYEEAPDQMLVCWVVTPDSEAQYLSRILENYVAERVDAFGLQRVLAIGLTVSSLRPYDALLVLEEAIWRPSGD